MMRRILAWLILIGFIFLIADILVIGWQRQLVATVYTAVVVVYFLFFMDKRKGITDNDESKRKDTGDDQPGNGDHKKEE